jgi:hypothetical protein
MICNDDSSRILEVSLGSLTRELWARRPELRRRVGREWTRLHYQNHGRKRAGRFLPEEIALLEHIAASRGHMRLMLAGHPRIVGRVRRALPQGLRGRLVDAVPASSNDRSTDVVLATLSALLEQQKRESPAAVGLLRQALCKSGLAVSGYAACGEALESGQADLLVILSHRGDGQNRLREELVRLAARRDVRVEAVQQSVQLEELGGVGCLLRYESWTRPASAALGAA